MVAAIPTPSRIPDHVPAELVHEIPCIRGATTTGLPHDSFQLLSAAPDVFYAPMTPHGIGAWVFRKAEHCRQVTLDTEHFSTIDFAPFAKMTGGHWKMIPIEIDPPLHGRYRSILNPLLAPKAIAALDEKVVKYAREYVSAFKDRGHCEFMSEFAFEIAAHRDAPGNDFIGHVCVRRSMAASSTITSCSVSASRSTSAGSTRYRRISR